MRVLFLDFDGVLNSDKYNSERDWRTQGNIDETRLPLLRRIIDETGAVIVLSTSWREHWDPDLARCAPGWRPTGELLARYGMKILDRTPKYGGGYDRDLEVRAWLAAHEDEVESFVILDDLRFGWGDLEERLPKPESAYFLLVLSPKPLTLRGALPHYLSLKKELAYSSS